MDPKCNHKSPWKKEARSKAEGVGTTEVGWMSCEDAGGATSQGRQAASRRWKSQGNRFPRRAFRRTPPCGHPDSCKEMNLCCFQPPSYFSHRKPHPSAPLCLQLHFFQGVPGGKEPICQCRRDQRRGLDPWVGKISWRKKWQPTPVFLPGESLGQKSLEGCSP